MNAENTQAHEYLIDMLEAIRLSNEYLVDFWQRFGRLSTGPNEIDYLRQIGNLNYHILAMYHHKETRALSLSKLKALGKHPYTEAEKAYRSQWKDEESIHNQPNEANTPKEVNKQREEEASPGSARSLSDIDRRTDSEHN